MYKEDLITAEDLASFFNLPVHPDGINYFQIHEGATSVDMANGGRRGALSWSFPTKISGRWKNTSYIIQYFETKVPSADNRTNRYLPRKHTMRGTRISLPPEKYELAVLCCLSPLCENSPFARTRPQFKYIDPQAEARRMVEDERIKLRLRQRILDDANPIIVAVAKGYRDKSRVIPRNELATDEGARYALIRELDANPRGVQLAYDNDSVRLLGGVMDAIDKHIIYSESTGGDGKKWRWSDQAGGGMICDTSGPDHIGELIDKMNSAGDRYSFFTRLAKAQGYEFKETENSEENRATTGDPLSLINSAILNDVILFNKQDSKVYILDERGQIKGNALRVISDPENWKRELLDGGAMVLKRIKKAMNDRAEAIA